MTRRTTLAVLALAVLTALILYASLGRRETTRQKMGTVSASCGTVVPTATATPAATITITPTATNTLTPLPTATRTPTPLPTATKTPTPIPPTATPVPVNMLSNASFENTGSSPWYTPWYTKVVAPAAATFTQDSAQHEAGTYSLNVDVTTAGGAALDVQMSQKNLTLTNGATYALSFWAKAGATKVITYSLQQTTGAFTIYTSQQASLTTSWQQFTLTYTHTAATDTTAALHFSMGLSTGHVWIDNVSLAQQ